MLSIPSKNHLVYKMFIKDKIFIVLKFIHSQKVDASCSVAAPCKNITTLGQCQQDVKHLSILVWPVVYKTLF